METDICKCGDTRKAHKDLMGEIAAAARPGAAPASIEIEGCLAFVLDRKATFNWERDHRRQTGRNSPRMATILRGCRACGAAGEVTYRKNQQGQLVHADCPGAAS